MLPDYAYCAREFVIRVYKHLTPTFNFTTAKDNMPFVNEYVSDDDIEKYRLDELWLRYHPEYKSVPSIYRHNWTIDRERNTYFMVVGGGGREENYKTCP
jgi:hypothetical protein